MQLVIYFLANKVSVNSLIAACLVDRKPYTYRAPLRLPVLVRTWGVLVPRQCHPLFDNRGEHRQVTLVSCDSISFPRICFLMALFLP